MQGRAIETEERRDDNPGRLRSTRSAPHGAFPLKVMHAGDGSVGETLPSGADPGADTCPPRTMGIESSDILLLPRATLAVVLTFGSAGNASTVIAASNLRAKEPEWSFDRIGDGHFGRSAGRRDVGLRPG
jgi:hypothetical protein